MPHSADSVTYTTGSRNELVLRHSKHRRHNLGSTTAWLSWYAKTRMLRWTCRKVWGIKRNYPKFSLEPVGGNNDNSHGFMRRVATSERKLREQFAKEGFNGEAGSHASEGASF